MANTTTTPSPLTVAYTAYLANPTDYAKDDLMRAVYAQAMRFLSRVPIDYRSEIANTAAMRVYDSLTKYRHGCSLSSWIYMMAKRCEVDYYRRSHAGKRQPLIMLDAPEEMVVSASEPLRTYDADKLDGLSAKDRDVLQRIILNPDVESVAEELGTTPAAITKRLQRIKSKHGRSQN